MKIFTDFQTDKSLKSKMDSWWVLLEIDNETRISASCRPYCPNVKVVQISQQDVDAWNLLVAGLLVITIILIHLIHILHRIPILNEIQEIDETVEHLTEEERESIKVVKIKKEDVDQDHDCAICLQDFVVNEDARELNCGGHHKFHEFCLFPWLEDNITCPICRERLK